MTHLLVVVVGLRAQALAVKEQIALGIEDLSLEGTPLLG